MTVTALTALSSIASAGAAAPRAAGGAGGIGSVASASPPAPVAPPAETASALNAAVQSAAGRQGGLSPLLADLEAALLTPGLPAPVRAAASAVLALQLPLDPAPSGPDLQQAMAQSGLFLEAQLALDEALAGPDLKAALLKLSQALEAWIGPSPAPSTPSPQPPAPPYPGGPVRGQPPAKASLSDQAPLEQVGARLAQAASGAIARQTLLQAASLPQRSAASHPAQPQQWLFEVPLATGRGSAIAQFAITRDGGGGHGEAPAAWRAGFSLDLEPMGPVHAKIVLVGDRVRVGLWAETEATAERLSAQRADLSRALLEEKLIATVSVEPGAPSTPAPKPGRLVDQAL